MPAHSQFKNVLEFLDLFGQEIPQRPTVPPLKTELLRYSLNMEETLELADAIGLEVKCISPDGIIRSNKDLQFTKVRPTSLVKTLDALIDIDYVNLGALAAYGFDPEGPQKEVHESNRSKLWSGDEVATQKPASWHAHEKDIKSNKRFIVLNDAGKVAKSPSYRPANFEQFVPKKVQAELF